MKRTYLVKMKRGKLPSRKIAREYYRLRKLGVSPEEARILSRVRKRKEGDLMKKRRYPAKKVVAKIAGRRFKKAKRKPRLF